MRKQVHRIAGFTLIEIMIVVAIIGMLMSVAIVNISKSRKTAQKVACIINLKAIDGAKEQWATEFKKANGEQVDETAVIGYLNNSVRPECPGGGTYTFNPIGQPPTCSLGATEGHTL
jgi:prepilin-type N-terminal cleavage/methylation domain-containing protein